VPHCIGNAFRAKLLGLNLAYASHQQLKKIKIKTKTTSYFLKIKFLV
jgi:hypothetical protein